MGGQNTYLGLSSENESLASQLAYDSILCGHFSFSSAAYLQFLLIITQAAYSRVRTVDRPKCSSLCDQDINCSLHVLIARAYSSRITHPATSGSVAEFLVGLVVTGPNHETGFR